MCCVVARARGLAGLRAQVDCARAGAVCFERLRVVFGSVGPCRMCCALQVPKRLSPTARESK
eukprot:4251974-Alexandrium_andersonii.AAC.1